VQTRTLNTAYSVDGSEPSTNNLKQLVPARKPRLYPRSVESNSLTVISQKPLKHIGQISVDRGSDLDVEVLTLAFTATPLDGKNLYTESPASRPDQANIVSKPPLMDEAVLVYLQFIHKFNVWICSLHGASS